MKTRKEIVLALCGVAAMAAMAVEVAQPAFLMKESELLAAIREGTNLNDRVTACQELCHAGTDAAVPALAGFLDDASDKALFHAALYALQNIPGSAAEAALKSGQTRCTGTRREAVATTLRLRAQPVAKGYAGDAPPAPAATPLQKGDASLLPALVEAACAGRDADARRALVGFPSAAADAYLAKMLDAPDAERARFAIGILAERRGEGRFADFARRAASAKDASLREAYFKSFDALCGAKDVPALLTLLGKFPTEDRLVGSIVRVCAREMSAEPGEVEIVSAQYGNFESNMVADVKEMVAALVKCGSRRIAAVNRLAGRGGFARDPAPGLRKELRVTYRFGGFTRFALVPEAGELVLAESVLDGKVADALYSARAAASGPEAAALDSILAALARRGRLPPLPESAFTPLFDGRSLDGWSQQDGFWSVQDGVITGSSTAEKPCKPNHHLVYTARTFGDFELRAQFRLSKGANSGIQLRCRRQFVGDNGYQADMDGGGHFVGFLYHPRQHLIGARGADVVLGADGTKRETRFADGKELQKLYRAEEWNDMRVICEGRRIDVWVNGVRTTSVTDAREEFLPEKGHIAVQLHQGPPMKVEFRNIRIKADGMQAPRPAEAKFRIRRIGNVRTEACGVADFDGDGRLDVIAGPCLYLAPGFRPVKVRKVKTNVKEDGKGYANDFMNLPLDVSGNGRPDVISGDWFSKETWWIENALPSTNVWRQHLIEKTGNIETGILVDLDGDGKATDFLPDTHVTCLYRRSGAGSFARDSVSDERCNMGRGCGDLNGDGRNDILTPAYWYERLAGGGWRRHPLDVGFSDGGKSLGHASNLIVYDVNRDGLADIIVSSAHKYGIFWWEQLKERNAAGDIQFRKHVIDDTWSQAHYLGWGDIDGDGVPELVTGKRFMAHNGGDPDEYGPLGVYYYDFVPGPDPVFRRHVITFGEGIGAGLNVEIADMDGDGDMDIVTTGKWGGPVIFENLAKGQ